MEEFNALMAQGPRRDDYHLIFFSATLISMVIVHSIGGWVSRVALPLFALAVLVWGFVVNYAANRDHKRIIKFIESLPQKPA